MKVSFKIRTETLGNQTTINKMCHRLNLRFGLYSFTLEKSLKERMTYIVCECEQMPNMELVQMFIDGWSARWH